MVVWIKIKLKGWRKKPMSNLSQMRKMLFGLIIHIAKLAKWNPIQSIEEFQIVLSLSSKKIPNPGYIKDISQILKNLLGPTLPQVLVFQILWLISTLIL